MGAEMTQKQTENNIDVIAGLIKSCRAGQAGFLSAAERTRNSDLGAYFTGRSMERARFAAELERVARQLGEADLSRSGVPGKPAVGLLGSSGVPGKPAVGLLGSSAPMAEQVHRAWVELNLARRASDSGILSVVAEAERTTRDFYRQALSLELPAEVAALLERQAESISDAYHQICTLRDMRGQAA
jgi:hypothetical protein